MKIDLDTLKASDLQKFSYKDTLTVVEELQKVNSLQWDKMRFSMKKR